MSLTEIPFSFPYWKIITITCMSTTDDGISHSEIINDKCVLSPLLFLIYINDISEDLTGLARLFADDTYISYSSIGLHQIEKISNEDLRKLNVWTKKWSLLIFLL